MALDGIRPVSDRLLTFPELKSKKGVPYTRQHLARLEKVGAFPMRRQLGANRVVWLESEVDDHLRNMPRGPLPLGPTNGKAEK
jgi:prophage regulatory protein